MPDTAYDSNDPRFEEADRKEQGRRDATDRETVRVWMGHPNGRSLLYRFVYETCCLGEIYTALDNEGRSDTHRTYLAMGMRNAGAWLDGRMREHAELYMKMLDEQRIEAELRASRLEKLAKERDQADA
jgi:hypothetical protein